MIYSGLVLLVASVMAMVLGFAGVIRGAGHIANVGLLAALGLILLGSLRALWQQRLAHRWEHRHAHH